MNKFRIAIVGNPNCGKTALFNALTGSHQQVGNWPGVTVERIEGTFSYNGHQFTVTDLPGIYSFSAYSPDEIVAREYILTQHPDLVINIVDASNLERNLYLTTQLLEMRVPMIIALNMVDLAEQNGIKVNTEHLAKHLDCPVVSTVASRKQGINKLLAVIDLAVEERKISRTQVKYNSELEKVIDRVSSQLPYKIRKKDLPPRWMALKLLEQDEWALNFLGCSHDILESVQAEITRIEKHIGDDLDLIIADGRYGFIHGLAKDIILHDSKLKTNITETIDKVVLNRVLGIPIFFFVMYLMFAITMNVGGPFIVFFDRFCGALFVDGFGHLLSMVHAPQWLITLLADGFGGGIQTVSTFIPPVFFIFLCLSFLEDSGYMARAAFVMDRFLLAIGLPGKAFIPMLVGFGCNVPGIMATRTLENNRDRILSVLINPFMSCGARLPVYTLFASAFFPQSGGILIFAIYLTGIILAAITGMLFKRTILRGEVSAFVMELPHYHLPTLNGILYHTWIRLKDFIIRAGKIILLFVVILSALNSIGTDGSIIGDQSGKSILSAVSKKITPVFKPMGIDDNNWPATVGLFTGIFAKETIVGTLNSLYTQLDKSVIDPKEEQSFSFGESMAAAFAAIPEGFHDCLGRLTDPLGISNAMHEIHSSTDQTHSVLVRRFGSEKAAIAYLLFILIYAPCVATMAAIYRETSLGWAIFAVTYLTVLAWTVAVSFYQLTTFTTHPLSSGLWLLVCLTLVVCGYSGLVLYGRKHRVIA